MADMTAPQTRKESKGTNYKVRYIAVTGVLAACAYVLQLIEVPVPFMPTFIKFDFSDLPALIGSFAMGPVCGIIIELLKNLFHALVSQSFGVGEISNFILGAVFVGVAGLVYKFNKTQYLFRISGLLQFHAEGYYPSGISGYHPVDEER